MKYLAAAAALVGATYAHGHHDDQTPIEGPHQGLWYNQLPGDGGTQVWLTFGIGLGFVDSCRRILSSLEFRLLVVSNTLLA